MRSVPTHFTSRKQKGKSRTLSPIYTPTAHQPYSRESFFNRPLNDNDSSALPPLAWDLLDHDQLKFLFCVLSKTLPVKFVVPLLHACWLRRKGVDAAHPGKPAAFFPLALVCMDRCGVLLAPELFFQTCVASRCSGEFVVVVVPIANG